MEGDEGSIRSMSAATSACVPHRQFRHIHRLPAGMFEAAAEVGILPVEEEACVESADRVERFAADDHHRARDPIHCSRRIRTSSTRREVVARQRVPGEDAGKPGTASGDGGGEIREPSRRRLHGAVAVQNPRTRSANSGMCVHPRRKTLTRIRTCNAIRVEQQHVARGALAGAAIDAGGEAVVRLLPQKMCVWERALDFVRRLAPRRVIDDTDRYRGIGRPERRQAIPQVLVALVVDNDDRDPSGRGRRGHRTMISERRPRYLT